MQVFDNEAGGVLHIVSAPAAVDFKVGINPLGIHVLCQLNHKIPEGFGRWCVRWYDRHMSHELNTHEEFPRDAVAVALWNVESIVARADDDDCPDLLGKDGRLAMLCRLLESLSQGKTVAVQGISAGLLTNIYHGRLVSFFTRS